MIYFIGLVERVRWCWVLGVDGVWGEGSFYMDHSFGVEFVYYFSGGLLAHLLSVELIYFC